MKKIYNGLLAGAMTLASAMSAQAYNLVVTVDNPELVKFELAYQEVALEAGRNEFKDLEGWNMATLRVIDDAIFQKVVNNGSVTTWTSNAYVYMNDGESETYTVDVTAVKVEDVATGSFTLTVDNPARVDYSIGQAWTTQPELVTGANTIHYIPEAQTYVSLRNNGGAPLYSVTVNGEKKTADWGQYQVSIVEGMNLDVKADYPDEKAAINFTFQNDGKESVTKVTVDGEEVTDWAENLQVQLGKQVKIYFNTQDFKVNLFKWNDKEEYIYGTYDAYVNGPADITIDATKYDMYNVTVNVDEADRIEFWKGYSGGGVVVALKNGENKIEVSQNDTRVTICPADGYTIDEVKVNGVVQDRASSSSLDYALYLEDNDVVDITTGVIIRDQTFAVYIEDYNDWSYLSVQQYNWYNLSDNFQTGYNVFTKAEWEITPIYLSGYIIGADYSNVPVYLDDNRLEAQNAYSFNYQINGVRNGSVLKIYSKGVPETCNVTFDVADDVEGLEVTRDVIVDVDTNNALECLAGTLVTLTANQTPVEVKVNGEAIEPTATEARAAGTTYEFTVTGNDKVEVTKAINNGVSAVSAENGESVIYNLQGVRVNATNLPAGIYIVNGKKTVVK